MGSLLTDTSPSTSSQWKTTEVSSEWRTTDVVSEWNTTEIPTEWNTTEVSNEKLTTSKKKKKKKKSPHKIRSNIKLIEFYKNDRRFVPMSMDENKTEHKENEVTSVRVMTYNILADGIHYALSDRHDYCPKLCRAWSYRYQSILCQLQAYEPDIVCIQETTPSAWKNKMQQPLKSIGYIGMHAARDLFDAKFAGLSQSDCIIWKDAKFTVIKHKVLRLNKFIKKPPKNSKKLLQYDTNYDKLLGSNKSMFRSLVSACCDVVIVILFKSKATNKEFIVCSSHLFWDPKNPEIKATQTLIFNIEFEKLLQEWSGEEKKESDFDVNTIPIIFGVDANSMPFKSEKDEFDPFLPDGGAKSGVYTLMVDGILEKGHTDHPFCRINEREKRYQKQHSNSSGTGCVKMSKKEVEYVGDLPDWNIKIQWKSVYSVVNKRNKFKEPKFTNRVQSFTETLDYIFISNKCGVKSFLEMPWQKELTYHLLNEKDENKKDDKWLEMELKKEEVLCESFPLLPNSDHPSDHLPLCADIIIH